MTSCRKQKDNVTIPNNLDDYYGYLQQRHGNLHGSAVYSRPLNIHLQPGKRYFLFFEGVGTYATLKINGQAWPRRIGPDDLDGGYHSSPSRREQ